MTPKLGVRALQLSLLLRLIGKVTRYIEKEIG